MTSEPNDWFEPSKTALPYKISSEEFQVRQVLTLPWHSYKFVGETWNMDILGLYFERRSLTLCKRVVKYAFEEPKANRFDIFVLDEDLRNCIKILKKIQTKDPALNKLHEKFIKLLDYLRCMEDKYYGKS